MKRSLLIIVSAAAVVYGANGYVSTSKISVSGCGSTGQALESNGDCTYQWATVATADPLTVSSETVSGTLYFGTSLQSTGAGTNNTVGNARGNSAVDLQTYRNAANQVASGDRSVIGGGLFNRASGEASTIAGGWQGQALGTYDAIGGGLSNTGFGSATVVGGGDTNDAHNNYVAILGGQQNTGSGAYDAIVGGFGCTLSAANSLCYSTYTITVAESQAAVFAGVHLISRAATAPVVSSCGSTPNGSVTGSDTAGTIAVGGGSVTSCLLTFTNAYASIPVCTVSDDSTALTIDISTVSVSAVTFGMSASLGGKHIYYICVGN